MRCRKWVYICSMQMVVWFGISGCSKPELAVPTSESGLRNIEFSGAVAVQRVYGMPDGSTLLGGSKRNEVFLSKLDEVGNIAWFRSYPSYYAALSLVSDQNNSIYALMYHKTGEALGQLNRRLVKLSPTGDELWFKEFPRHAISQILAHSNGSVVVLKTESERSFGASQVAAFSATGDSLWTLDMPLNPQQTATLSVSTVVEQDDESITILCLYSHSGSGYALVNVSTQGKINWTNLNPNYYITLPLGDMFFSYIFSDLHTTKSGYVWLESLGDQTAALHKSLVEADKEGNIVNRTPIQNSAWGLVQNDEDDLLLYGSSFSHTHTTDSSKLWMAKLNNDLSINWEHTTGSQQTFEGIIGVHSANNVWRAVGSVRSTGSQSRKYFFYSLNEEGEHVW